MIVTPQADPLIAPSPTAPVSDASAERDGAVGAEPHDARRDVHIKPLTSLRFFAALFVVLHHFGGPALAALAPAGSLVSALLNNWCLLGFVGVDFFFVLSGFILTYTYMSASTRLSVSPQAFWLARVARIYPVFLVAFIVALPPFYWYRAQHPGDNPWATAVATLTMVQAWAPLHLRSWNGPAWSLSAEAFFYLTFPFAGPRLIALVGERRRAAVAVLWALSLAGPLAYLAIAPDGIRRTWIFDESHLWWVTLRYTPVFHLPSFFIGIVAAGMYARRRAAPLTRRTGWGLLAATLILAWMSLGALTPNLLAFDGVMAPLFAWLIFEAACATGRLARLLSLRWLVLLGEASYALYIVHYPAWQWLAHTWPSLYGPRSIAPVVAFALYLIGVAMLSIALYRWVETPARRWLRLRLSGY